MFRKNEQHLQGALISDVQQLGEKQRRRLEESWAGTFYREFFCRIQEEAFAVLYADEPSRPNVPVNVLVGLEALKAGFGWSDEQMHDAFTFDLQVRYALGYRNLSEGQFDLRTVYNFRQRLSRYNLAQGSNLLAQAFAAITTEQLTAFQVRTGKQRMDSTQIASHMLDMSRVQLAVEALQRLTRLLGESERARYAELLEPYTQGKSGQVVYRIKGREEATRWLQQIGQVLHSLLGAMAESYAQEPVYKTVQRLFEEHFRVEEQKVAVRPGEELPPDSLQSLDDQEATYRRKGQRSYKGYVANVTESCDSDNALQLITHVQVAPNHVDDSVLLVEALPELSARTQLDTLITDGSFGSLKADEALQAHHVEQIQTGLRGHAPNPQHWSLADFDITQDEAGVPLRLGCPQGQAVQVERSGDSFVAHFDPVTCGRCPHHQSERCQTKPGRHDPRFHLYFTQRKVFSAKRRQRYLAHQQDGKNLRVAVEATVRSLKHPFRGHLPVRGQFRVSCLMIATALMVNVRRIQHYLQTKPAPSVGTPLQGAENSAQAGQNLFVFALNTFQRTLQRLFQLPKPCFSC